MLPGDIKKRDVQNLYISKSKSIKFRWEYCISKNAHLQQHLFHQVLPLDLISFVYVKKSSELLYFLLPCDIFIWDKFIFRQLRKVKY